MQNINMHGSNLHHNTVYSKASLSNNKPDARWSKTRKKLIDGGREVFAEKGVEATSVLDIVRAAGVSQPSFYNHFDSKDLLALEIAADFFRRDKRTKQLIFEQVGDPAAAIAINVNHTLSMATDDPVIAWTFIKSDGLRELVISSENDPLASMINIGVEQGRFDVSSSRTAAIAIRGGALAIIQDLLNQTADADAVKDFQSFVLRLLGLSPEESRAVVSQAASIELSYIKQEF
jgi:AcrR family transcriptional regulator